MVFAEYGEQVYVVGKKGRERKLFKSRADKLTY